MSDIVITSTGLSEVNRSFPSAPLFGIKYFVPVYDYRIDSDVNTGMTSAISYASTVNATSAQESPTGEIIWNSNIANTYSLSQKFIVASGTVDATGENTIVTGYAYSSMGVGINLSAGYPLTTSYSATTLYSPSIGQNYWTLAPTTSYSIVNGVGHISAANMRNNMWKVTDYYPVEDGSGHIQGAFKCNINNSIGTYKFNKIALYITRYKTDGTEDTTEIPKFFAEAFVDDVSIKTDNLDDGYSNVIIDVRLDFDSYGIYSSSGFFSNSANDWTLTTSGIYYPERVGIGSFNNSVIAPQAQIHVRPSTIESNAIRIDSNTYGDTNCYTLNVIQNNDLILSASNNGSLSANNIKCDSISATYIGSSRKSVTLIQADEIDVDTIFSNNTSFVNISSDIHSGNISATDIKVVGNISASRNITCDDLFTNNLDPVGMGTVINFYGDLVSPALNSVGTASSPCSNVVGTNIRGMSTVKSPTLSAGTQIILSAATVTYDGVNDSLLITAPRVTVTEGFEAQEFIITPRIYTNEIDGSGSDIVVTNNIVPSNNHQKKLGSLTNYFANGYIDYINATTIVASTAITVLDITATNDISYGGMIKTTGQTGTYLTSGTSTTFRISLKKESNFYDLNRNAGDQIHGIEATDGFNIGDVIFLSNTGGTVSLHTDGVAAAGTHTFYADVSSINIGTGTGDIRCMQFVFNGTNWLATSYN